jgi:hypothetical protein
VAAESAVVVAVLVLPAATALIAMGVLAKRGEPEGWCRRW